MADVSKLRLGNTSYDIKDDNARRYLVMVNEEPVSATKMVVDTGEDEDSVELAYQEDLDSVEQKVDWFVTPEMYGAVGDGVTNDTAAVRAAIETGKNVLFSKTYKVNSNISIYNDSVLSGEGKIIQSSTFSIFTFSNCKVTISGLSFSGPTPTNNNPGSHMIELVNCTSSIIENCDFNYVCAESAIYVESSDDIHIIRNRINNYSFIGVLIYKDCDGVIVDGNTITNCVNTSQGYGIQNNIPAAGGAFAKNLSITNNVIRNVAAWDGIMSHGGENITISGNICESCRTGIDCSGKWADSQSVQKNYVITNNTLTSSTDTSIAGSNINVGIIFGYNAYSGQRILSENAVIANNIIKDFNIGTGTSTTGGLRIANAKNVRITGNSISGVQRGLIFGSDLDICSSWTIIGNTINVTLGAVYFNSGIFEDVIFEGNDFTNDDLSSTPWAFVIANSVCLIKTKEKNNTFKNVYQTPPSPGARLKFYTEKENAVNNNQSTTVYNVGDTVMNANPTSSPYHYCWIASKTGIKATTAWTANTAYTFGTLLTNSSGSAYIVTVAGTSGSSKPTHTSGEATNGTTTMRYLGADSTAWVAVVYTQSAIT